MFSIHISIYVYDTLDSARLLAAPHIAHGAMHSLALRCLTFGCVIDATDRGFRPTHAINHIDRSEHDTTALSVGSSGLFYRCLYKRRTTTRSVNATRAFRSILPIGYTPWWLFYSGT